MMAGQLRIGLFLACCLAGMILRSAPLRADEASWVPVSQVMSELSRNPDFVAAVYQRLGRNPNAGGILGPDEIKRLRELILGRNFEALDRFPGLTIQGMGRAVRLAAAAVDSAEDHTLPATDTSHPTTAAPPTTEEDLGIPAAGEPPAPDAYLRSLGFGLTVGDRVDSMLAVRYADGLRLADMLNRLALNPPDGEANPHYRVAMGDTRAESPRALLAALTAAGHDLEVRDARYFANFGDLIYHGRDVLTPFWIDTGLPVPGTDRTLLVPVTHSQHEVIVRGPVVNADLSFYYGIDGKAEFRPIVTRDQSWVMGKVAHRYRGGDALEAIRLAGAIVRAYDTIKRRNPDLPFGGYYALGVCNDVNALIELHMQGETSLFPLTLNPHFFADSGEVGKLAQRLPLDSVRNARPEPQRILASLPVDSLAKLPLPALRQDLEAVQAAWLRGDSTYAGPTSLGLQIIGVIGVTAAILWLFRRRTSHRSSSR